MYRYDFNKFNKFNDFNLVYVSKYLRLENGCFWPEISFCIG